MQLKSVIRAGSLIDRISMQYISNSGNRILKENILFFHRNYLFSPKAQLLQINPGQMFYIRISENFKGFSSNRKARIYAPAG